MSRWQKYFSLTTAFRSAARQSPSNSVWNPGVGWCGSSGIKPPSRKGDYSPRLATRLRMWGDYLHSLFCVFISSRLVTHEVDFTCSEKSVCYCLTTLSFAKIIYFWLWMNEKFRRNGGMVLMGRRTGRPVAVPFCWPQIRHYRAWDQTQTFVVRGRRLTNDSRPVYSKAFSC